MSCGATNPASLLFYTPAFKTLMLYGYTQSWQLICRCYNQNMQKKIAAQIKRLSKQQRAGLAVLAVIIFVLLATQLRHPERSVAAYCKVYGEEKARLAKLPGDTYQSGVFNEAISDAGEFAKAYGKLGQVAPPEIQNDINTLEAIYQKIDDDPAQALSASLSAISVDDSVKAWTKERCTP